VVFRYLWPPASADGYADDGVPDLAMDPIGVWTGVEGDRSEQVDTGRMHRVLIGDSSNLGR
jgi:hypothetical protein